MINTPTNDVALTGVNIMKLRNVAGLSIHDLPMIFGFDSPQATNKWQKGTALQTVDNLIILAALRSIRIDDIRATTTILMLGGNALQKWSICLNG